jgi:ankyrin repeat protein
MFATILNDDPAVVHALLDSGADVDAETHQGMTALMWSLLAETRDHTACDILSFLEREANRQAVALKLIQEGADVNAMCYVPRWKKWTPLLFATLDPDRNASIITELIAAGANVNAQTTEGVTPLIHASGFGRSSDVVHELIQAGANVNAAARQEGRSGWTPLLYALASPYKSLSIVKELIRNDADVNILVSNRNTPLFFAVNIGDDPSFAEELLRAGASIEAKDNTGSTALDCARAKNYKRVVHLLSKTKRMNMMAKA